MEAEGEDRDNFPDGDFKSFGSEKIMLKIRGRWKYVTMHVIDYEIPFLCIRGLLADAIGVFELEAVA